MAKDINKQESTMPLSSNKFVHGVGCMPGSCYPDQSCVVLLGLMATKDQMSQVFGLKPKLGFAAATTITATGCLVESCPVGFPDVSLGGCRTCENMHT